MKNVFLSQFLMISEWKTIVFLIAYLLLAFAVYKLPKKKFSFSSKVLIATVLGLALGLAMQAVSGFAVDPMKIPFVNETTLWYSLIGNGFIDFIRMLVIPLVMVSIIHVILHMDERENVRKLVKRSILTTMGMVAVAAVVGRLSAWRQRKCRIHHKRRDEGGRTGCDDSAQSDTCQSCGSHGQQQCCRTGNLLRIFRACGTPYAEKVSRYHPGVL